MIPTGRQFALRHGDLSAVVTELGASLRELTWRGRPLVVGFEENELPVGYQGLCSRRGRTGSRTGGTPSRGNLTSWT